MPACYGVAKTNKRATLSTHRFLCLVIAATLARETVALAQTTMPAAADHKTFRVTSGTLFVSPGLVQFESSEKDLSKAEEKSWSASCDQITRCRRPPHATLTSGFSGAIPRNFVPGLQYGQRAKRNSVTSSRQSRRPVARGALNNRTIANIRRTEVGIP
jgi:hypothetical protein